VNLTTPDGLRPLVSPNYVASLLGVRPDWLKQLASKSHAHYSPFDKVKANDPSKTRRIDNPREPLKSLQREIKTSILEKVALPDFMHGGVRRRSARSNAGPHVGRAEVLTLDIRGFFPNIGAARIRKVWKKYFCASGRVADMLTALTAFENHLPQGSPASNAIANLVALPLGYDLARICETHNLAFTIYVDDITISGKGLRPLIPLFIGALAAHGFAVSASKVKLMGPSGRQAVTGVTVNRTVSNGGKRLRHLGGALVRGLAAPPSESDLARLRGQVVQAKSVNKKQGRRLVRLYEQLELRAAARQLQTL
jgi:RNA-directed DNA polymerase